jgi:chromosome segregation ATPase
MENEIYNALIAAIIIPMIVQLGAFITGEIKDRRRRNEAGTSLEIERLKLQVEAQKQNLETEKRMGELLVSLTRRSEDLDKQVTQLRLELDKAKVEIATLTEQNETKDAQLAGLSAKVEQLMKDNEAALKLAQTTHDKEIEKLQQQITDLKSKLSEKDKTIEARDKTIELRDAEIVELTKRMGDMSLELNKLKQWKLDVEKREATPPPDIEPPQTNGEAAA